MTVILEIGTGAFHVRSVRVRNPSGGVQFCANRLGADRRADNGDHPEHSIVFTPGHQLWRRWENDVWFAGYSGTLADAHGAGFRTVRARSRGNRGRGVRYAAA